jgi:RHS repeat-associated protein
MVGGFTPDCTSTLVTSYTYDAANRLTAVNGQAYTWDANGNLLNDGSKAYLYDSANRLITVTAPGLTWSAAYNGDGARLKQTANGAETTYTLDLAAPLVTVLAQQDAGSKKQYVYGQGDSPLARYDGTTWMYLSGRDGLNSVRQETDAAGDVLALRSFDPYGVPLSGNGGVPFGYTGEMWDSYINLVFLRARYMQPGLGMFLSRDPWRGNSRQPITLNRSHLYANQNPINRTDCMGLWPTEGGIGDIREVLGELVGSGTLGHVEYQYSCNCGWIDWAHALAGMQRHTSLAHTIFDRLEAEVDWSAYPMWTGERGILVESSGGAGGIIIGLEEDVAIAPESNLGNHTLLPQIATGIFMEHSERVEEAQLPTITSYFSEEDLPSDLIGLYIAARMHGGESYLGAVEEIISLCQVAGEKESRDIYENEYHGGGSSFAIGWRQWDARLTPITRSCVSCDEPRRWPSQFSNLASSAVHSAHTNGTWWWDDYPVDWQDEILRQTNVDGVYALERRSSP